MSAGFNAFDHDGFNGFVHSGFNARGDLSTKPATNIIMCFDAASGAVAWVWRLVDRNAVYTGADLAGNAYLIAATPSPGVLVRVKPDGDHDFEIVAPNGGSDFSFQFASDRVVIPSLNGGWFVSGTSILSAIEASGNVVVADTANDIGTRAYPTWADDGRLYFPSRFPPGGGALLNAKKYKIDGVFSIEASVADNPPSVSGAYIGSNIGLPLYFASSGSLWRMDRTSLVAGAHTVYTGSASSLYNEVETSGKWWNGPRRYDPAGGAPLLNLSSRIYPGNAAPPDRAYVDKGGNVWVGAGAGAGAIRIDPLNGNPLWSLSGQNSINLRDDWDHTMKFADNSGGAWGSGASGTLVHINNQGVVDQTSHGFTLSSLYDYRAGYLFVLASIPADMDDPVNVWA